MTKYDSLTVNEKIEHSIRRWQKNHQTTYTPSNILYDHGDDIVRAVNSHAALVEALEATSKILIELLRIADNDYADDIDSGLIKARAALTLAKGG